MAKSIMIVGTMSSAGKSFITAGLCRIFHQDGLRTVPFKSQNMALNSYITRDGLEMGRAQVMQAKAAGVEPDVRMNPILLKPTSECGSQVIVNGEVIGTMRATEYYQKKKELIPQIQKVYQSLAAENDVVVLEGAGSPAEINLRDVDIVNMGMAELSDSPVLLVGDIDRGGVFASVYGTIALLKPEERRRICGIIINKFRGDVEILKSGLTMLEELTHVPVLGVVPYVPLVLEEEDSLSERFNRKTVQPNALVDFAVIRFPRISNFTDFDALEQAKGVSVRYVTCVQELGEPDCIVLPGTKSTMADLRWLRQSGLEAAVFKQKEKGTLIFGICGGFQMLGKSISDPDNAEGGGFIRGMELLDIETCFLRTKKRIRTKGNIGSVSGAWKSLSCCPVSGYEIHMGETIGYDGAIPFTIAEEERANGYCNIDGTVCGTYLHGIFDTPEFAQKLAQLLAERKHLDSDVIQAFDYQTYQEMQYDRLAEVLRTSLDMKQIYHILNKWESCT